VVVVKNEAIDRRQQTCDVRLGTLEAVKGSTQFGLSVGLWQSPEIANVMYMAADGECAVDLHRREVG
jgi:hypothetical protein